MKDCGVSHISAHKRKFLEANKTLTRDQLEKMAVEKQIEDLIKRRDELEIKIEKDTKNVVIKGMIYYDSEKREHLLREAEHLSYSQLKIEKIRQFNDATWNADNVDFDVITELQAIETHVGENSEGIFGAIGRFTFGGDNK